MLLPIVKNIARTPIEGELYLGCIYLACAADACRLSNDDLKHYQPVDVRGFIDHRYSRTDNIYGCLKIAQEIEDALRNRKDPVVFCDGGLERSPLAIAVWYSWMHDVSLDFAYKHIKEAHPGIHRRDEWIQRKGPRI